MNNTKIPDMFIYPAAISLKLSLPLWQVDADTEPSGPITDAEVA